MALRALFLLLDWGTRKDAPEEMAYGETPRKVKIDQVFALLLLVIECSKNTRVLSYYNHVLKYLTKHKSCSYFSVKPYLEKTLSSNLEFDWLQQYRNPEYSKNNFFL